MKRQLDAEGYDVVDDTGRGNRLPVVVVGVASAVVVTVSAGLVAYTLSQPRVSEHTARAAQATVVTALGHTVTGGPETVQAALPTTTALVDGGIGAPVGLTAGTRDEIPARVLESYRKAESTLASESPECRLPWWLLAGVGKVASDHAAGGQVDASGTATVRIVGPRLDGTVVGGNIIRDTDKGALDGDLTYDRGVGPMLIVPQTWQSIGRDAGDGTADVSNADDAALAVGTLLCSAGSDLGTAKGLAEGLVQLDDTASFPTDVLPWAEHYRTGMPTPTESGTQTPAYPSTPPSGTEVPTQPGPGPSQTADATPTTVAPTQVGPGFTTQDPSAPPEANPPAVPARPAPSSSSSARPTSPTRPTGPARPAPVPTPARPTATPAPPAATPTATPGRTPTRTTPPAPSSPRPTTPSRTTTAPPATGGATPAQTPTGGGSTPSRTATRTATPEVTVVTPDDEPADRTTSTSRRQDRQNQRTQDRQDRQDQRTQDRQDRREQRDRNRGGGDGTASSQGATTTPTGGRTGSTRGTDD